MTLGLVSAMHRSERCMRALSVSCFGGYIEDRGLGLCHYVVECFCMWDGWKALACGSSAILVAWHRHQSVRLYDGSKNTAVKQA